MLRFGRWSASRGIQLSFASFFCFLSVAYISSLLRFDKSMNRHKRCIYGLEFTCKYLTELFSPYCLFLLLFFVFVKALNGCRILSFNFI